MMSPRWNGGRGLSSGQSSPRSAGGMVRTAIQKAAPTAAITRNEIQWGRKSHMTPAATGANMTPMRAKKENRLTTLGSSLPTVTARAWAPIQPNEVTTPIAICSRSSAGNHVAIENRGGIRVQATPIRL